MNETEDGNHCGRRRAGGARRSGRPSGSHEQHKKEQDRPQRQKDRHVQASRSTDT